MGMLSPPNRRCFLTTRKRATSFHRLMLRILAVLGAALCMLGTSAVGYAKTADVQTAWRLLDYMAVDYGGAVSGGQVKSASEYAEMTEFAASVSARLATLPPTPERAKLIEGATRLQAIVAAKGPPSQVADLAHGLARSEEHTSELQSLMRISYAVFCLKTKNILPKHTQSP